MILERGLSLLFFLPVALLIFLIPHIQTFLAPLHIFDPLLTDNIHYQLLVTDNLLEGSISGYSILAHLSEILFLL